MYNSRDWGRHAPTSKPLRPLFFLKKFGHSGETCFEYKKQLPFIALLVYYLIEKAKFNRLYSFFSFVLYIDAKMFKLPGLITRCFFFFEKKV